MDAPAAFHIWAKVAPAERSFCPFTSEGWTMHPFLEPKAPASQASASTTAPPRSISALMSFMKSELFSFLACSWLFTRPGIRVAPNIGWRPDA